MISLRKINSILVIIMILMMLHHVALTILFLFGFIPYSPSFKVTGRRLFYPLVLHIIISCYLYLKDKFKGNKIYPKLIKETKLQFFSGMAIVVFVSFHILSYMMFPINSSSGFIFKIMHLVIDILLVVSISIHLNISIPRLLVSWGFLENKNSYINFKNKFSKVIYILMGIVILADVCHWVVL